MTEPVTSITRDPADSYLREAQTFPRLNAEMAARVAAYGTEERLAAGTLVFERGQRGVDFLVVLEGAIEIVSLAADDELAVVTTLTDRQFAGELDQLNNS